MLLSRRRIIPKFDNAPDCVLDEMLECEGITMILNREDKIRVLNETKTVAKVCWESGLGLTMVSRFVEPKNSAWRKSKLKQAYDHILLWEPPKCPPSILDLDMCLKTNESTDGLNLCMIYRSSQIYGLELPRDISPEKLFEIVRYHELDHITLRNLIRYHCLASTKRDLVKILMGFVDGNVHRSMTDVMPKLDSILDCLVPVTDEDFDRCLMIKYRLLPDHLNSKRCYRDLERSIELQDENYLINPKFHMMNNRWVQKYAEYYTQDEMKELVYREGLTSTHQLHSEPEFIFGVIPGNRNKTTMIYLDAVESLESIDDVLTFGNETITFEEYLELIKSKRFPINPVTEKSLSSISISKLKASESNSIILREILEFIGLSNVSSSELSVDRSLEPELRILLSLVMEMRKDIIDDDTVGNLISMLRQNDAILKLELVNVHESSMGWDPSLTGLCLGEKFDQIDKGWSGDESSCMRTSSNILGTTVWWYLTKLNQTPPFDIKTFELLN